MSKIIENPIDPDLMGFGECVEGVDDASSTAATDEDQLQ